MTTTTSTGKSILRPGRADDATACGQICYDAFCAIARKHNFPPDFPAPDVAQGLMKWVLSRGDVYGVVAELGGRVVGSNFLWENGPIAGVGPITVDTNVQDGSIGRRLMEAVLERARERRFAGVRLVQSGYHARSLALYTKLGFVVREPLVNIQGAPLKLQIAGHAVRAAKESDVEGCADLCRRVHGHDRSGELRDAIGQGSARVVEHDGRISGYATDIGFFGHAACESNTDLKALIGAAPAFSGPGFLLPSRNHDVFEWCLNHGLRVVQTMTLMSVGLYNEPAGAFLPSILF